MEELRATLGQDRRDAAFAEGLTMLLDEAVAFALSALDQAGGDHDPEGGLSGK